MNHPESSPAIAMSILPPWNSQPKYPESTNEEGSIPHSPNREPESPECTDEEWNIPSPPPPKSEYPDWTEEDGLELPWKYIGYRVFSRWVASDQAFFVVRRFGALNTRVLLALQDEITEIDQSLNRWDKMYSRKGKPEDTHNGSFRSDPCPERSRLILKILPKKLARYNNFINEYLKLVSRPPVDPANVKKVERWLHNVHPSAIHEQECEFIGHKEDLIQIHPKIRSRFRNFLEVVLLTTPGIKEIFKRIPDDYETIKDEQTIWANDERIERLSLGLIGLIGLAMLIGPLWILEFVDGSLKRLGAITSFITGFFLLVGVATTARIFDVLAATAAYSAVLMVFLQIGRV